MIMKQKFIPKRVKTFPGPVSPVVIAGDYAYLSGQISMDPDSGDVIKGTIQEETKRVLENIRLILEDMGLTLENIVKCDVYLSSIKDFDGMNSVYREFLGETCPPARTCVAMELWGEMKIEVSAVILL